LHKGKLIANGNPEDVITEYMHILYPSTNEHGGAGDTIKLSENLTDSSPVREINTNENIYNVDLSKDINRWGRGGATLESMRFFGLLPTNRFVKGQKIIIECDYRFDPSVLCTLAAEEGVVPELAIGMRIDAANGMPLCDFSSVLIGSGKLNFDVAEDKFATFRFEGILPNLAPGDYFFTPEVSIGHKDSYLPIVVNENAAILQCDRTELIVGLFKPEYTVQRIS
jgi:hypothetical protein